MSLFLIMLLISVVSHAAIITVPDDFLEIQVAIDSSMEGDTVLVRRGRYEESLHAPDFSLTLSSEYLLTNDTTVIVETILLPTGGFREGRCIRIDSIETTRSFKLIGLTLFGGNAYQYEPSYGGAIIASNAELVIENCRVDSCIGTGGGIFASGGRLEVSNSKFRWNGTDRETTNIYTEGTDVFIDRTAFLSSYALNSNAAGHLRFRDGAVHIENCLFSDLGWNPDSANMNIISTNGQMSYIDISNCEFAGSRINMLFSNPQQHRTSFSFESNYVHDNQIFSYVFQTVFADSSSIQIVGNVFSDNEPRPGNFAGQGLFVLAPGQSGSRSVRMYQNLFIRNTHRDNACGIITGQDDVRIVTRNYFIDNSAEGLLWPPGGAVAVYENDMEEFQENIFCGNHGFAVHDRSVQGGQGYARHNYWNHETGPYHPSLNPFGQGDSVDTLIVFEPWEIDTSFLQDAVSPQQPSIPTDFLIGRVYPNPFNSEIEIEYVVTGTHDVKLAVYDLLGRKVTELVNEQQRIGIHRARWQPDNQSSGIYFARLHTSDSPQSPSIKKIVYLK